MKASKFVPFMLRRGDGSTLSLDFTAMSGLDSRFTYTRNSIATFINSSGLVQQVTAAATNDPTKARFDYDPSTLAPRGLLIEGSATNELTNSNAFTSTGWFTSGSGTKTITTSYATGPDGVANSASRFQFDQNCALKQLGGSTGTNYANSIWVKSNTGSATTLAIWSGTAAITVNVTTSWTRVQGVSNHSSAPGFDLYNPNSGTCDVLIWGAQREAGSGASSYIPTGASTVQRAADSCQLTGTNFSSWFNATQGTFFARGQRRLTSNTGMLLSANDATNSEAMGLGSSTTGRWLIRDVGSDVASISPGTVTANTTYRIAGAYAVNDAQAALNGTLGTADTSLTLPTVNQLDIGRDRVSVYLDGYVELIKYWPTRLPNSQLQAITA